MIRETAEFTSKFYGLEKCAGKYSKIERSKNSNLMSVPLKIISYQNSYSYTIAFLVKIILIPYYFQRLLIDIKVISLHIALDQPGAMRI